MNTPCPFSDANLHFNGSPVEQARCLLRPVLVGGNVNDTAAVLPHILETIIGQAVTFTEAQLSAFLTAQGIAAADVGGALDQPLSHTPGAGPLRKSATYFVIHDTSDEIDGGSFPSTINTAAWAPNNLASRDISSAHIFINRLGESKSGHSYGEARRATKFEKDSHHGPAVAGLFLHHELIQPRIRGGFGFHAVGPTPGFTAPTYRRLALCYLAASLRRGSFLIPVSIASSIWASRMGTTTRRNSTWGRGVRRLKHCSPR